MALVGRRWFEGSRVGTVLERALIEHNILVLSKIYLNISFEQIGKFLDIHASVAENVISEIEEYVL